jgi:hypothetical protein
MILEDYDAAPDGLGAFEKLNKIFDSVDSALQCHSILYCWCWGKIETLDGTFIQSVVDVYTARHQAELGY